ncbi:MAG: DUF4833 domain-containing protein [Endomicrobium sp.]|jgi:hypothetical protein|nr:DUF4833 domain-containing protein [Endomicrobium sp.]
MCSSATIVRKVLFTISKNQNKNIVVYDIKLNEKGEIINNNPIEVYWLIYTNKKYIKTSINKLEEKAYGFKLTNKDNQLVLTLIAQPKRKIYIKNTPHGPKAVTYINNKQAFLSNVYVCTNLKNIVFPKVIYYTLTGTDILNGVQLLEKVFI